jgi:hypothetical protein
MKTILLATLLFAFNVHADRAPARDGSKKKEFYRTGPSLESLRRMYAHIKGDSPRSDQSVRYLGFNYFIYNKLKDAETEKEKDKLFAYHEVNYFNELCNADKKKDTKNGYMSSNCQTFAIKMSNYSDFVPKYMEDKRSKFNPTVKFNFENDTYSIKGKTYSIATATPLGESYSKPKEPTKSLPGNTNK